MKHQLMRFAWSLLGSQSAAEDVVQDVMVKIWSQNKDISAYSNLEALCMKMTKNQSLDILKASRSKDESLTPHYGLKVSEKDPAEQTEMNDQMNRIHQMISYLPEKQQQIMRLRDMQGLAYEEIATHLGLNLNQIKVNLHRARKSIRDQLVKLETQ